MIVPDTMLPIGEAALVGVAPSRELLAAALLCRYDHPLDECRIMNDGIDRRLIDDGPPVRQQGTRAL